MFKIYQLQRYCFLPNWTPSKKEKYTKNKQPSTQNTEIEFFLLHKMLQKLKKNTNFAPKYIH